MKPPAADLPEVERLIRELAQHLDALASFWRERAADPVHGGYRTTFDSDGDPIAESEKYLLSHTRLLWSFAELVEITGDRSLLQLAERGLLYLHDHFLDRRYGGWFWKLHSDGTPKDAAKLVYGQAFAIYALAKYGRVAESRDAITLAESTFDSLLANAADTAHGGYYENLDRDWSPVRAASGGGDLKSLDIHMHLLEAFTELAIATGKSGHHLRLKEIRQIVLEHMIDRVAGCGGNQYDLGFRPVSPIVLDRTWIAERTSGQEASPREITTSYGHNLELGWLLSRADEALGLGAAADAETVLLLADHALSFGYDYAHGGIFREGPPTGPASDRDKEFWQNSEALVGFLNAYQLSSDLRYLDAFSKTWRFAGRCLIHPSAGEWRVRVSEDGHIIDGHLGNHWTGGYHTVRAAAESHRRLRSLALPD